MSFVSTLNLKTLKKLCKPVTKIVKAAPLPMAEDGLSKLLFTQIKKL